MLHPAVINTYNLLLLYAKFYGDIKSKIMSRIIVQDLLENAIDSLCESALKYKEGKEGKNKSYKFAVLNFTHFIELILKHYIAYKDEKRIYKKSSLAKSKKPITIGFIDCINFIQNENPNTISLELKKDIEWLKKLRNQILHYKFTMDIEQVEFTLGRSFWSIMEFLKNHTEIDIHKKIPVNVKNTFEPLSAAYKRLLEEAVEETSSILDYIYRDGNYYNLSEDNCSECGNDTLVLDPESSSKLKCTFCGYECDAIFCDRCEKFIPLSEPADPSLHIPDEEDYHNAYKIFGKNKLCEGCFNYYIKFDD